MRGVRPEPLALEVALAHYVASLPEGKAVPLADVAVEDGRLVKHFKGGYEKDFRRPVRLSPVQARAALLALDVVSKAVDPGIVASLRNKVRGAVAGEVGEVAVGRAFDEDVPVVAAIDRARREERLLEIRYPSDGTVGTRTVEPLLMSGIEGRWYLNAYCRRAEGARLFRLDRILSARALEEHFAQRSDVELRTEYEDIDPRGYAAKRATVRFSREVARWMEERPELDLIEKHGDGSADYALYYTEEAWAARRVMQYLGEAVVIEPEELRHEVSRRASALLEAYGGNA